MTCILLLWYQLQKMQDGILKPQIIYLICTCVKLYVCICADYCHRYLFILFNRCLENIFLKFWTQNQVEDIIKFSQDQLETDILMMQKEISKLALNPKTISEHAYAQAPNTHIFTHTLSHIRTNTSWIQKYIYLSN